MNKNILLRFIAISVGALLINACGPTAFNVIETAELDNNAADNWIYANNGYSEWGGCNNAMDDDGDSLRDSHDPDCHVPGPMRDASLVPFPQGHNYFPNIALDLPHGPGYGGGFRDPALITRWLRFLTEPGFTAGINLMSPGVNPSLVPLPAPLPKRVTMGSTAFGNNNNLSSGDVHEFYVDHAFLSSPGDSPYYEFKSGPNATGNRFFSTNEEYHTTQVADQIGIAYTAQGPGSNKLIMPKAKDAKK